MNIAIIVHSQTGNTHSVAVKLQERLTADGHTVTVERLKVAGGYRPGMKEIRFEEPPDPSAYDAVIFGAPVEAFSLSPVMAAYVKQAAPLDGKTVACLVTQAFPFSWMGGNRAVTQMKKLCESKGSVVRGDGIVNWMNERRRARKMVEAVEHIGSLFHTSS